MNWVSGVLTLGRCIAWIRGRPPDISVSGPAERCYSGTSPADLNKIICHSWVYEYEILSQKNNSLTSFYLMRSLIVCMYHVCMYYVCMYYVCMYYVCMYYMCMYYMCMCIMCVCIMCVCIMCVWSLTWLCVCIVSMYYEYALCVSIMCLCIICVWSLTWPYICTICVCIMCVCIMCVCIMCVCIMCDLIMCMYHVYTIPEQLAACRLWEPAAPCWPCIMCVRWLTWLRAGSESQRHLVDLVSCVYVDSPGCVPALRASGTLLTLFHVCTLTHLAACRLWEPAAPCWPCIMCVRRLTWLCAGSESQRHLVDLAHDLFVGLVDRHEHLCLGRQLSLDVGRAENALEIQPVTLTVQPLVLKHISEWLID